MPNTDLLALIESVRREAFEQGVRLGRWTYIPKGQTAGRKQYPVDVLYKIYKESLTAPLRVRQAMKGIVTRWTNT